MLLGLFALGVPADAGQAERRWTVAGGESGRGAADTPAVRAAPTPAWSQRLTGELESEPLIWDERVLLSVRERSGRRRLVLLDLASGRRLAQHALAAAPAASPATLSPSLYGDRFAVRVDPERIDLLRVRGARFEALRSFGGDAPVSAPLLDSGALFLRHGDALEGTLLDRNEPAWRRTEGGVFRGDPVLADGRLFAVRYDARGNAALLLLDPNDGRALEAAAVGAHGGTIPDASAPLRIAVHDDAVFLRLPLPVRGSNGGDFHGVRVGLTRANGRPSLDRSGNVRLYHYDQLPAQTPGGWLGRERPPDGPGRWVAHQRSDAGGRTLALSHANLHPRLLAAEAAPVVGGGVALLGDTAADAHSWEVLWRLPAAPKVRPVPCDLGDGSGGWLVSSAPQRLELLRSTPPTDAAATRARELLANLARREAESLAELAQRAVASGDVQLVGRLVRAATARGVPPGGNGERALALAQDGLARLYTSDSVRTDPRAVAALETEEAKLLRRLPDELVRGAREGSPAQARRLLSELARRAPGHPQLRPSVRALLPAGAPVLDDFDPLSWLEFLAVAETLEVRFERPSAEPSGDLAQRLAREAREWRADVWAFRSDRVAVLTPPGRPGDVAQALAVGELVCDALESLFPGPAPGGDEPLILLLYEDAESYRAQSERDRSVPEVARGWTAGHFDPHDLLSRMFVPTGEDRQARLLETFAHELTHHWLAVRAPFATRSRRTTGAFERPGFWLTEGIANLVGEFAFEPHAGAWRADDPRASSLDGVANADPDDLLDWGRLLTLDKRGFDQLSLEREHTIALTWKLGTSARRSELNLFYDQAGALAHTLFSVQGGRHRAVLLDAVEAYATAGEPVDVLARTGWTARSLGEAVRAHARERQQAGARVGDAAGRATR